MTAGAPPKPSPRVYTYADAARMMGVAESTIGYYVGKRRLPKLCDVDGWSVDELDELNWRMAQRTKRPRGMGRKVPAPLKEVSAEP